MRLSQPRPPITLCLMAFVTFLGAALRFWQLGGQSLWLDEVFTARTAALDVGGILRIIRSDLDTPPLHPLLVHWFLALGNNEFVLRLPAAMAGVLSIPLMYLVGQRLLGRWVGLVAALFMALSPFAVYYAQEARMYALVLLFALLSLYCLLRALGPHPYPAPPGRGDGCEGAWWRAVSPHPLTPLPLGQGLGVRGGGWWLAFVLASALGVYTHFFGFLVLGLEVLYAGLYLAGEWRAGQRESVRRAAGQFILALVAVGLLYLPWSPVLLNFVRENYAANPYGQGWQANMTRDVALNMLTLMLGGYWAHPIVRWATRILFAAGVVFMVRRRPLVGVLVVLSVTLPFVLIAVLNPGHFVTERYFIFMLPMLALGMAEGLVGVAGRAVGVMAAVVRAQRAWAQPAAPRPTPPPWAQQAWAQQAWAQQAAPLLVCLMVPLLSASGLERYYREPPKPAWRLLARYVAGTVPGGDLIVVATFPHWDKEPLQHYLNMGGRHVIYAAEEPNLREKLAEEQSHPWWILYAGRDRRLGRLMRQATTGELTVIPFDYLAVVHRNSGQPNGLDDGRMLLGVLAPRIPHPYHAEVERVLKGLAQANGAMGQPIPPPLPTTVK